MVGWVGPGLGVGGCGVRTTKWAGEGVESAAAGVAHALHGPRGSQAHLRKHPKHDRHEAQDEANIVTPAAASVWWAGARVSAPDARRVSGPGSAGAAAAARFVRAARRCAPSLSHARALWHSTRYMHVSLADFHTAGCSKRLSAVGSRSGPHWNVDLTRTRSRESAPRSRRPLPAGSRPLRASGARHRARGSDYDPHTRRDQASYVIVQGVMARGTALQGFCPGPRAIAGRRPPPRVPPHGQCRRHSRRPVPLQFRMQPRASPGERTHSSGVRGGALCR